MRRKLPLPSASRSRTCHSRNRRLSLYFHLEPIHWEFAENGLRPASGLAEPSKPFAFSHLPSAAQKV
jgi:hypothetical protein